MKNSNLINFGLERFERVHFLGCGGVDKTKALKKIFYGKKYSVDVSTPINRAIDGSTSGAECSGVYSYKNSKLIRINPRNKERILSDYATSTREKVFSLEKFEAIINGILTHQSHRSSEETYNDRARLIIINADVFRQNAEL